ncbi:MAG: hypothetical protein IR527_00675 [Bacteroides sp.]|nr:MAG: hypothetical protein IR527_00675 [Bacteroides sp.]
MWKQSIKIVDIMYILIYLLFLGFVITINVYISERLVIAIHKINNEILVLKCDYILNNAKYINYIKESSISEKANLIGLYNNNEIPIKINISINDIIAIRNIQFKK